MRSRFLDRVAAWADSRDFGARGRQHAPGADGSKRVSISRRSLLTGGATAGVGGFLGVAAILGSAQEASPPAEATPPADAGTATPAATPGATPAATPGASPAAEGATEFTIVMGRPSELAFDPNVLTIPANTDVTIFLPNEGSIAHDFHITELSVNTDDLQPGDSTTVTVNAEPGEYEYYCDVGEHRDVGMVGTLIVQ